MTAYRAAKTTRESANILHLAQDLGAERLVWSSRPTEIEFGFNNHCNLLCVMCHQADGIPAQNMPIEAARDVLDDILPFALHLTPSDASEPLMNDLDEVVRLCEQYGVLLSMYCNGTLLDEKRLAKIAPWTHRIWFSIDSPDKATFETLRVNANFERVVENIRRTMPVAEENLIEVAFNAVAMAPNWDHMPELVDFIADLGGQTLAIQELLPNSTGYEELKIEGRVSEDDFADMVRRVRERGKARNVSLQLQLHAPHGAEIGVAQPEKPLKNPIINVRELHMDSLHRMSPGFCSMAMNYLKITPDGKVFPCCRGPEELEMGNVLEQPFEKIWNGERYQEFRRQMFSGEYAEVCATCLVLTGTEYFPGRAKPATDGASGNGSANEPSP
jgi:radical SAM protein with 4Fe4S-binding SPASM domain